MNSKTKEILQSIGIDLKLLILENNFLKEKKFEQDPDSAQKFVLNLENEMMREVSEWIKLGKESCYYRLFLYHPITQELYIEFITKFKIKNKEITSKKQYISCSYLGNYNDPEVIKDKKINMTKLKTGNHYKLLYDLAINGLIYFILFTVQTA